MSEKAKREAEVFARQLEAIPPWPRPRNHLGEWIPIAPVTDNRHAELKARFPIKWYQPAEMCPGSDLLEGERRAALVQHLGEPLEPDGPLLHGAPSRGFWWISVEDGHFEGMIAIVDTKGDCYAAYAPQHGKPTVWPNNVPRKVRTVVSRSARRLLALSKGEPPDKRFAKALELKAKLAAQRAVQPEAPALD